MHCMHICIYLKLGKSVCVCGGINCSWRARGGEHTFAGSFLFGGADLGALALLLGDALLVLLLVEFM